ncbi:type III secretion protein [Pseudomonas sp. MAFF 212408]|uniref:Type III secretion protein n=1 Tax=Pseudomonas kitaguniensis TaxID=2607908 RepID=A0A5N7KH00_9PSED|nr:type III secretion protein [Pseudomonas kitaguniensis]MPR01487.1 type III secretion protein [Pseudomonas kitaguniensis]
MSEDLSWARWWAFPWENAHVDWLTQTGFVETTALSRSHHGRVSSMFEIAPELPPPTSAALLKLVLSRAQQQELVLELVNEVYNAPPGSQLNQEQLLWCQRLAKALPTGPTPEAVGDPLHYLRAWVPPVIWQRLRLSFARPRVLELEQKPKLADTHGRLDTLWQATIWRATSTPVDDALRAPRENSNHVLRPQD